MTKSEIARNIEITDQKVQYDSCVKKLLSEKIILAWIQMNVDEELANKITEYGIAEKSIVGNGKEKKKDYDLISVIMLRLGNAEQAIKEPILRLLDVLLLKEKYPEEKKDILEKDFDIPMTVSMKEAVQVMCNPGEGLYEEAYEEAYEKAVKEMAVAVAKKLLARGKNTIEEISEDTGLSVEEIENLSNLQPV